MPDLTELRREIKARYGSVYAYAKQPGVLEALGMSRGTLYQVLTGRYGGDLERQAARIRTALEIDKAGGKPDAVETLKRVACGRCRRKRPRTRQCGQCRELWRAQAAALAGEGNEEKK